MIFKIAGSKDEDTYYLDLVYDMNTITGKRDLITLRVVDTLSNPIKNGNIMSITNEGVIYFHPHINKKFGFKIDKRFFYFDNYFCGSKNEEEKEGGFIKNDLYLKNYKI